MLINTARDKSRTDRVCYIIEAALEYFIYILVTGAYLARITTSLGFSDSLTGILSSFVSLGCVFQLGSIALFRRIKHTKRPIMLCDAINQLLFSCVYLTPVLPLSAAQKTLLFLLCFCSAFILSNLISPAKVSWLMGMIPDRSRGSFTARKEIVSLLGGMSFSYLSGSVIDHFEAIGNLRMSFIVGSVSILVLMLLHATTLFAIREQPVAPVSSSGSLRSLKNNKMYRLILPVIMCWNIAHYSATPFYGAYQIKELGFSMTFVSVLSIAYSLVRVAASPLIGRYADKTSFSRMVSLCFSIAAAGFFINCFTVPENGSVFYTLYYCLSAVSMAGINSALTNLIYDCVRGEGRRSALAISSSLGGICGFGSTCLMSTVVAYIQRNGNRLFGLSLYPAQFVSGVAFILTSCLVIYLCTVVIPTEKKKQADCC